MVDFSSAWVSVVKSTAWVSCILYLLLNRVAPLWMYLLTCNKIWVFSWILVRRCTLNYNQWTASIFSIWMSLLVNSPPICHWFWKKFKLLIVTWNWVSWQMQPNESLLPFMKLSMGLEWLSSNHGVSYLLGVPKLCSVHFFDTHNSLYF